MGWTRWKEGDVLLAKNDWLTMAYVVTDDPAKLSGMKMGLHGPDGLCVGYITAEQAKAWDNAEDLPASD